VFSDWPKWYQSCADTPVIFQALSGRGFSNDDIMKFAGGNWLRFFEESFKPQET
jgi:microsomal dipeptidase-like Zn-dependent dipeptidase